MIIYLFFFLSFYHRRSLLVQLAGAFHHLGVEVVLNPMTLLEDISGEDIFQSRTVLVKQTLSALYRASGPSSRGKPLRRRSIFQDQLPASKAGVLCFASDRPTYLIDLPYFPTTASHSPKFLRLKGKGKPGIPLKGNPGEKPALKQSVSWYFSRWKTARKKSEWFHWESNPRPLERRCFRD